MTPSDLVLKLPRKFPQGTRTKIAFALCMEPAQVNRICHSAGIPPLERSLRRKWGVPYLGVDGKRATAL